jgi:hypothetical protein
MIAAENQPPALRNEVKEMFRGLYFNSQHTAPRYLSVEEIATACRLSVRKVENLVVEGVLRPTKDARKLIDVSDVLWFLVRNKMPVATSLLPPKTGRILFIAAEDGTLHEKEETFDRICSLFADHHNLVLAESTSLDRAAHLSILTFSPNVVVIFAGQNAFDLGGIRDILAGVPGLKTILIGKSPAATLHPLQVDLAIGEEVSPEKLSWQLNAFFSN